MAIVKMEKFTLVSLKENTSLLLKKIQGYQGVELLSSKAILTEKIDTALFHQSEQHQALSTYEDDLKKVEFVLEFLQPYVPKAGGIKQLKVGRRELSIEEIDQFVMDFDWQADYQKLKADEQQLNRLTQDRVTKLGEEEELNKWRYFDENPNLLKGLTYSQGILGVIPDQYLLQFKEKMADLPLTYVEEIFSNHSESAFFILTLKEQEEALQEVLTQCACALYQYPYKHAPTEKLTKIKQELAAIHDKEKTIKAELATLGHLIADFQIVVEYYANIVAREEAYQHLADSKHLVVITGWVPAEETQDFTAFISETTQGDFIVSYETVKEEEIPEVPIKLKNNWLNQPFENLTEMYSLPKYNEIDPTPLMTPFYLLFFGMMVADVGYGLVLLIGTTLLLKLFNLERGFKKSIQFFQFLSVPTIVWGLIYGSFFGVELPFHVLSTSKDVNTILITSVVFGFIQMLFGLGIKAYMLIRNGQKIEALFEAGSWMSTLIGLAVIIVGNLVLQQEIFTLIGIIVAIFGMILIVLSGIHGASSKGKGIAKGLYNLYGLTGYIGDLVSYTRLMALGISGGSIAAAFNMIVGFMPPVARFTLGAVLFVALHSLNIFLSYLSAYVHGARLQYVEYFGKFYEGGGRAFRPFKTLEKYIYLKEEKAKTTNKSEEK